MTDSEKAEIRKSFIEIANIQADTLISTYDEIDKAMPADYSQEQRKRAFDTILKTTHMTTLDANKKFADELKKNAIKLFKEGEHAR